MLQESNPYAPLGDAASARTGHHGSGDGTAARRRKLRTALSTVTETCSRYGLPTLLAVEGSALSATTTALDSINTALKDSGLAANVTAAIFHNATELEHSPIGKKLLENEATRNACDTILGKGMVFVAVLINGVAIPAISHARDCEGFFASADAQPLAEHGDLDSVERQFTDFRKWLYGVASAMMIPTGAFVASGNPNYALVTAMSAEVLRGIINLFDRRDLMTSATARSLTAEDRLASGSHRLKVNLLPCVAEGVVAIACLAIASSNEANAMRDGRIDTSVTLRTMGLVSALLSLENAISYLIPKQELIRKIAEVANLPAECLKYLSQQTPTQLARDLINIATGCGLYLTLGATPEIALAVCIAMTAAHGALNMPQVQRVLEAASSTAGDIFSRMGKTLADIVTKCCPSEEPTAATVPVVAP